MHNKNKNIVHIIPVSIRLHGKSNYVWGLLAAFTLSVTLVILEFTNVTHFLHKQTITFKPTTTTDGGSVGEQKGETKPTSNSTNTNLLSTKSQPGDNKSNVGGGAAPSLLYPTGDFVSTHGSINYPVTTTTQLSSVCTTTPGSTCQIIFTKDHTTRQLPPQITDRAGATYWNNWYPQQYNIATGAWRIQAVAYLNGQTKTSSDAQTLMVTP